MVNNQSQQKAPLVEMLKHLSTKPDAAFYAPGHKRGQGIASSLTDFCGHSVFKADLPELPELDNLFAPEGVIKEAQELAAQAFGADHTWFLVNGSTCGVMAAILATCGVGDKIILPRNIHQSAIAGLILSGATPIFINPEYNSQADLVSSISVDSLRIALEQHPDTKAVMIVYPTYEGICADLEAIATLTHQYNIPLLVDEAHGPHFAFHPDLPISALATGADLTVQSTHKVLGAMTQASMLHIQGQRIDREAISRALQLLQSTSPSYLLLASLDAARQQMALEGKELLTQTINLAEIARNRLAEIKGLSILSPPSQPQPGFFTLDTTRLTVNATQLGLTGYEADEILHKELAVTAELPTLFHLSFIVSIGNHVEDIDKLIAGFTNLATTKYTHSNVTQISPLSLISSPPILMTPRDAYFATKQTVSRDKAIGNISAEIICPYPPGIPVIMPGEVITAEAIDYLQQVLTIGGNITGCSDSSLTCLKVIGS